MKGVKGDCDERGLHWVEGFWVGGGFVERFRF